MEKRKQIVLVDDNITNLAVGKNALLEYYDVFTVPSGEKLFKILEKITPDLILLDVEMPEMDGYEVIRALKGGGDNEAAWAETAAGADKAANTANIPVIFLTARLEKADEEEGLALGAVDYITKPFAPQALLQRVQQLLEP